MTDISNEPIDSRRANHVKLVNLDDMPKNEPAKDEPPRPLMRTALPASKFPVEGLTETLKAAALAIHDKVQCPVGMCAQSVLAAATLATQGHADLCLPIGTVSPIGNIYISIGASGERKSGADKLALKAVKDYERELRERYESEIEKWHIEHATWKRERELILNDKKATRDSKRVDLEALGPEPEKPLSFLLTSAEPTIEGLLKNWISGQPSQGIFSAEGGVFIGGHGMSDENKLRSISTYSLLWDGAPVTRVRAGDGISSINGRRLSVHLMAQNGVAGKLLSDPVLVDQGFLARCLISAPPSTQGTRFNHDNNPQSDRDLILFNSQMRYLLDRPFSLVEGSRNELEPRIIQCSPAASKLWFEYLNYIERQLSPDGDLSSISGLGNKLPEHAARIAAVMTIFDDPEAPEIDVNEMEGGIKLAGHYGKEALRLNKWAGVSEDIRKAEKLRQWIDVQGLSEIYPQIVYQRGPNEIRQQSTAKSCLATLEAHGWLRKIGGGGEIGGKHRRDAWEVVKGVAHV